MDIFHLQFVPIVQQADDLVDDKAGTSSPVKNKSAPTRAKLQSKRNRKTAGVFMRVHTSTHGFE